MYSLSLLLRFAVQLYSYMCPFALDHLARIPLIKGRDHELPRCCTDEEVEARST